MDDGKTRPVGLVQGNNGYKLFNFHVLFVNRVYHQIREGKKVRIKEVAVKEVKAGFSATW